MLQETEHLHSLVRRYQAPDEYPFFPDAVEKPILKPLDYPIVLHPNTVDVNQKLKESYIEHVLPHACAKFEGNEDRGESKEHYGSAATCDVSCLQALSRRIHYGKFVAESKFRKETERFVQLIKDEDREGIDDAITDMKVEKKVLERLRLKAKTYGTDPDLGSQDPGKINVEAVVAMYKVSAFYPIPRGIKANKIQNYVIPLTKEVEVEYLMQRLKGTQWE
jgi:chorismate mutase